MILGQNVGNTSAKRFIVQDIYILTEVKKLCVTCPERELVLYSWGIVWLVLAAYPRQRAVKEMNIPIEMKPMLSKSTSKRFYQFHSFTVSVSLGLGRTIIIATGFPFIPTLLSHVLLNGKATSFLLSTLFVVITSLLI